MSPNKWTTPFSPQWPNIRKSLVAGYKQFEDKRPIVLYDIQAKRAYLCPYEDFKNDMSPQSQVSLAEQYELAGTLGKMVMFCPRQRGREARFLHPGLQVDEHGEDRPLPALQGEGIHRHRCRSAQ